MSDGGGAPPPNPPTGRDDPLARFNALSREEAEQRLYGCLASRKWADRMVDGRPYDNADMVFSAADRALLFFTPEDWLAAFASHPRIGEGGGHSPGASKREQRRAIQSSPETLSALAEENRAYEARFGHVFLIAAAGRSGEEVLAELGRRVNNTPQVELQAAREELRKIMISRLTQLLDS